mgnify:CR=1 FL=1
MMRFGLDIITICNMAIVFNPFHQYTNLLGRKLGYLVMCTENHRHFHSLYGLIRFTSLAYWRLFYEHRAISIIFHRMVFICHRNFLAVGLVVEELLTRTSPEGLWNMVTDFLSVTGEFLYCNYRISMFLPQESTAFSLIPHT